MGEGASIQEYDISELDEVAALDETGAYAEHLRNPEHLLGFSTEALTLIGVTTRNYPSIFYEESNVYRKSFDITELVDPLSPGFPLSNVTGYTLRDIRIAKQKYPDSLAVVQAEASLAIQAYCFLAVMLLRKAGKTIAITPIKRGESVLNFAQLLDRLNQFQKQVSEAISELSDDTQLGDIQWLVPSDQTDHSLVLFALLLKSHEGGTKMATSKWADINAFVAAVEAYEPLKANPQFISMLTAAILDISSTGLDSANFQIRRFICREVLHLSNVVAFDAILTTCQRMRDEKLEQQRLDEDQTKRQEEKQRALEEAKIRRETARQKAESRFEQMKGKGHLKDKSLLPQPPEGADVVSWLGEQPWYRERVILGAAKNQDRWQLRMAYPLRTFVYQEEYLRETLKRAQLLEDRQSGIISFLLRFGITQYTRYRPDDLIEMYANFLFGSSDTAIQPHYLHLTDTHDHNNAFLVHKDRVAQVYRKQGIVKPLFCEFNSPFELYKILYLVRSLTASNPKLVYFMAHGEVGRISYPNSVTTNMVSLMKERTEFLGREDHTPTILIDSCRAADDGPDRISFARSVANLGVTVYAPEWLSYGIKSVKLDEYGGVSDARFNALDTKKFEPGQL